MQKKCGVFLKNQKEKSDVYKRQAVVARGMGKCCVSGAHDIYVDEDERFVRIDGKKYSDQDVLSIDGSTGNIYVGALETENPKLEGTFGEFMSWVDKYRDMKVRTNADTPHEMCIRDS